MDNTELDLNVWDPQIHFNALWRTALQTLNALGGKLWTDHAEHDPGITLLQALTYNVSDLSYRHTHPLTDLLTPTDADCALRERSCKGDGKRIFPMTFGPDWALTCTPITPDDYRRAILDLSLNESSLYFAYAELEKEPDDEAYTYQYDATTRQYQFKPSGAHSSPNDNITSFQVRGGYVLRVVLNRNINRRQAEAALTDFLKNSRNLCEQVRRIEWLKPVNVDVRIDIEIDEDCQDPEKVLAQLYWLVDDWISPKPERASANQLVKQGLPAEVIYNGPRLQHGWITRLPAVLGSSAVDISGLASPLLALANVTRIMKLQIGETQSWTMPIEAKSYPVAWSDEPVNHLIGAPAPVRLFKRGLLQVIDEEKLRAAIDEARAPLINNYHNGVRIGQRRSGNYTPASTRIPPCYGLQDDPSKAAGPEKDRTQRLYQFFLLFEQWIAGRLEQLTAVPRILAFDRYTLNPGIQNLSGFAWPFKEDREEFRLGTLYQANKHSFQHIEKEQDIKKELSIIDYLLSYFDAHRAPRTLSTVDPKDFVKVQQGYIEQFCELTYNRANIRIDRTSALQKRIAARLGLGATLFDSSLTDQKNLPFYLVEYRRLLPTQPNTAFVEVSPKAPPTYDSQTLRLVFDERVSPPIVGQLIALKTEQQAETSVPAMNIPWALVESVQQHSGTISVSLDLTGNSTLMYSAGNLCQITEPTLIKCSTVMTMFVDMEYMLQYAAINPKSMTATLQINQDPGVIAVGDKLSIRKLPEGSESRDDSASPGCTATVNALDRVKGQITATLDSGHRWPDKPALYYWFVNRSTASERFSFQIGIVLSRAQLQGSQVFQQVLDWVEQIVREEVPCHITPHIHWLAPNMWDGFRQAYRNWQNIDRRLGDSAFSLLEALSLGKLPRPASGIGVSHVASIEQQQRLYGGQHTYQNFEDVKRERVNYVPKPL